MRVTAEWVAPGHPDKICDRISDAILDACLRQDPKSRVAVETFGGHGLLVIGGEVTTTAKIDYEKIARKIIDNDEIKIIVNIVEQSPEIARGVDNNGAGDQGVMVGYATTETKELMPLEVCLARSLNSHLRAGRSQLQDGKTQVTLDHNGDLETIVSRWCGMSRDEIKNIIEKWLSTVLLDYDVAATDTLSVLINPAGDWNIGGFDADTGLTGRKLAIDNYGPRVPIGGGAFSGKDFTKVDRSGAYMARHLAIRCLMYYRNDITQDAAIVDFRPVAVMTRLAYAIGYPRPVEVTATLYREDGSFEVRDLLREDIDVIYGYDLSPAGMIKHLDLGGRSNPNCESLAMFGHFGCWSLPRPAWEKIDAEYAPTLASILDSEHKIREAK